MYMVILVVHSNLRDIRQKKLQIIVVYSKVAISLLEVQNNYISNIVVLKKDASVLGLTII